MHNLGTSECSSVLFENYRSKDEKMQFDFFNQLLWPYLLVEIYAKYVQKLL